MFCQLYEFEKLEPFFKSCKHHLFPKYYQIGWRTVSSTLPLSLIFTIFIQCVAGTNCILPQAVVAYGQSVNFTSGGFKDRRFKSKFMTMVFAFLLVQRWTKYKTHHIEIDKLSSATCFSFQILASDVKDGILIVCICKDIFQAYSQLKQIISLFQFGLKHGNKLPLKNFHQMNEL